VAVHDREAEELRGKRRARDLWIDEIKAMRMKCIVIRLQSDLNRTVERAAAEGDCEMLGCGRG
jgi:hypothetical protein